MSEKNQLLELIMSRTSYRGTYKQDKVPREDLKQILEAGLAAPSGCNKQTTSLIAVDDEELLNRLKRLLAPPIAQSAPAFILVLTQKIIAYRNKCYHVQDYSACIENMLLANKALGYEGHITDEDDIAGKMAKELGVPSEYEIVCLLPVGIAEEANKSVPMKSFEERAWFNGFRK